MIHDVSSHDVLGPACDRCAFVERPYVHLAEYDAQPGTGLEGMVQLPSSVVDEIGEPAFEIVPAVEIEHAREEAAVVRVCGVHSVGVWAEIVTFSADVLAEPEPRVESVRLPGAVVGLHSRRNVVSHSLPEELGQLGIVGHEPIVPSLVVHEAVRLGRLVADSLRRLRHGAALVGREGTAEDDPQSSEELLGAGRSVGRDDSLTEVGEHWRRAPLRVSIVVVRHGEKTDTKKHGGGANARANEMRG